MKCPQCNEVVGEQDKFCGKCGYHLQIQKEIMPDTGETKSLSKKQKRKVVHVVALVAIAVCVLVGVVFVVFFGKESPTEEVAVATSTSTPTESPDVTEEPEEATSTPAVVETSMPYWQKYLKAGKNTLTERQREDVLLLFQKALGKYGVSWDKVDVDMDEIDTESPEELGKMYMPTEIFVEDDGTFELLIYATYNYNGGSIYVDEYTLTYSMSENSPYEHFCLESYEMSDEKNTTDYGDATASSVLSSQMSNGEKISYTASNLVDEDMDTAWVEGVSGYGKGSWIKVSASESHPIYGIAIRNGYNKSEKTYTINARPKKVKFTFAGGKSHTAVLSNERSYDGEYTDVIMFDEPIRSKYVKMTIQSVYEGEDYYSYYGDDDGKKCSDTGFDEIFVIHSW